MVVHGKVRLRGQQYHFLGLDTSTVVAYRGPASR